MLCFQWIAVVGVVRASSCSVECGNDTRTWQISQAATMSGQTCTEPSTEICIVTSCMIIVMVEITLVALCAMIM